MPFLLVDTSGITDAETIALYIISAVLFAIGCTITYFNEKRRDKEREGDAKL